MNAFIPRASVHAWSDDIAENIENHQTALARLLKGQRRLTRFVEENQKSLKPGSAQAATYLTGVVIRMFDLATGGVEQVSWEHIRKAEDKVKGELATITPFDDGFLERFRGANRAQPHILDEAVMALFNNPLAAEGEMELPKGEMTKILLMLWVIVESLDGNWAPGKDFAGESAYTYVHIEPKAPGNA
jgi:hypothetical protein